MFFLKATYNQVALKVLYISSSRVKVVLFNNIALLRAVSELPKYIVLSQDGAGDCSQAKYYKKC